MSKKLDAAVAHINKHGALLVFPLKNSAEPNSLWRCLYPRSAMRWDWSATADGRVPELWHLREQLSRSDEVVYTKWYQGRATFFSRPLFTALLHFVSSLPDPAAGLDIRTRLLLDTLEDDSPLGTKALRELAELSGKEHEGLFTKGMRVLWKRLLAVGYGEVAEGGFPSLAVGATKVMFEDLWDESREADRETCRAAVLAAFSDSRPFFQAFLRFEKSLAALQPAAVRRL